MPGPAQGGAALVARVLADTAASHYREHRAGAIDAAAVDVERRVRVGQHPSGSVRVQALGRTDRRQRTGGVRVAGEPGHDEEDDDSAHDGEDGGAASPDL